MMLRSLSTAVLALALAIPAAAQQKDAAAPRDLRQQVEAVTTKWVEAINKGDAKTAAALATTNTIDLDAYGLVTGRKKAEERTEAVHQKGINLALKIGEIHPLFGGQGAVVTGSYTASYTANPAAPQVQGNWLQVMEREGNEWKISVAAFARTQQPSPAVATGQTGAQPSTGSSTPPTTGTTSQQNPTRGISK